MSGAYSTTWKFINLAWMARLPQLQAIGTFTTSICVAQDMSLTGLPCWLIWESKTFGDEKIFSVAEVFYPKDYIVLGPHKFNYPVIYTGPATGLEKFTAIERFACNSLCSQDPFGSTPSSLAGDSQPSTSSTPAIASSSATPTPQSTGQNSQEAICRPVRGRGAGKFSAFNIH
jgi:hypothetical protein